jgi:Cu(I)/Ag(I) efflux system membrane fusion protein
MSGTVVARSVYEGQYVEANDRLLRNRDFSRMWFVFDAYEPDLALDSARQPVELSVPSRPGEVLTAPITFIDPNVDPISRTARGAFVLDNASRRLLHRQTAQAIGAHRHTRGSPPPPLRRPRARRRRLGLRRP